MTYQPRRPLWRLILGVALMAYGLLMLALDLYGLLMLGRMGIPSAGAVLVGAAALFIGWRLYRVD